MAAVRPTSGAHWSWKWSGMNSVEYPSASARRARSRQARPSGACDVITPKRSRCPTRRSVGAGTRFGPVHPRVSVSALSSFTASFDDDIALWTDLGVHTVGLFADKLDAAGIDAAVERVRSAGLGRSSVACLGFELARPEGWPAR